MRLILGHWQLIILTVLMVALWETQAILPLRLLVVFFHELSHALMTWFTGGQLAEFIVNADVSGHVKSRGGNYFLILQAGYLGSLLIGAGIFAIAVRSRWDKALVAALGVTLIVIVLMSRDSVFTLFAGLFAGAVLIALSRFASTAGNDLALRLIGLASMISVPRSLWFHTISWSGRSSGAQSDAHYLAEAYGGLVIFWGGIWLLISLAVIATTLRRGLGRSSNISLR